MSLLQTRHHKLPMLAVSQAQKEITHNEALVRIDALLHTVVEDELATPPVLTDADIGKSWLVSIGATGDWAGRSGELAIWIGGGWRFCSGADGMRVRFRPSGTDRVWANGIWMTAPNILDPAGGNIIDSEARAAINALLGHLRLIGMLTS